MQTKKFPKNCWSKVAVVLFSLCFLFLCFIFYVHYHANRLDKIWKERYRDEERVPILSLMTVNIRYEDSTYCVIAVDAALRLELEKSTIEPNQLKLPYRKFLELSYNDTLDVDSTTFSTLKKYMVSPQHRIDSIYSQGGIQALVASFFKHECLTDTTLNDAEQRYLIDVLQRNSFKFLIGDETGFWYFVQPKE